jgi:hypothetical protein
VKGKVEASKGMGGMDLSLYVPTADGYVRAQDKWTREPVGVSVLQIVHSHAVLLQLQLLSSSACECFITTVDTSIDANASSICQSAGRLARPLLFLGTGAVHVWQTLRHV